MLRLLVFAACLGVLPVSKGAQVITNTEAVCNERACKELAEQVESQMGNATPCQNFHNYVCGKWHGDKELKRKDLKEKAIKELAELLWKEPAAVVNGSNSTAKLITAFKSCIERGDDENALRASVRKVLSHYELPEWPVLAGESKDKNRTAYQYILMKTGPRPLISYTVLHRKDEVKIRLTAPSGFYVFPSDYYTDYSDSPADDEIKSESISEDDAPNPYEQAYNTFIKDSISLLDERVADGYATQVANEIIEFEKSLSQLATQEKKRPMNVSLSELSRHMGDEFPIANILRRDLQRAGISIEENMKVFVEDIEFFTHLNRLMKRSSSTTLVNYISWTKIREMAKAEGTLLHKIYLKYLKNVRSEPEEITDRNLACVRQLLQHNVMYTAVASYYSQAKFPKTSKEEVTKMMHFLKTAFLDVVERNKWMSEKMKEKASKRVSEMIVLIGYPDWIMNKSIVDSLYKFVPEVGEHESFASHFHWMEENDHFQKVLKEDFQKQYEEVVLQSHVDYKETENMLVYPAAALRTHFRGPPIPRSVNFATIGTVLVQLMTTAIGRFHGRHVDFWDTTTRNHFCNRSKCLDNTEECNDTKVFTTSCYQKLHDYFGARVSHMALQQSKRNYSDPFLLPGEVFTTEDKMFFIFFGSLYCPYSVREEIVQGRNDEQEDSFAQSLNEVSYNYDNFNSAFGCQQRRDQCRLMPPVTQTMPGANSC